MRAALDVILLLRFRVFLVSRRSWNDQFLLLNLAGSLWLMLLQTVPSKRILRLLRLFGTDPWVFGWQRLEQAPCLYVIFPYPVQCSCHGPLFYVGETILFRRRMVEHFLRIIAHDGATQQPFYKVVRRNCSQGPQLLAALSFLMMVPVCAASADTGERLMAESALCHSIGTLNPPRVYSLLPKGKQRQLPGMRIFDSHRPLCRLRPPQDGFPQKNVPLSLGLIRKEWRDGSKKIASALAGHRFEHSNASALAAWNLSPGAWAYVARCIDQCEEGWRRKRGLRLLGVISKKRRDLCPFVSSVVVSVPWVGSVQAQSVVRTAIRGLLSAWRQKGLWVPVAQHAKCFVSWSASPSLASILSDTSLLRKALEEGGVPRALVRRCGQNTLAGLLFLLKAVSTLLLRRVVCLGLNSFNTWLGGLLPFASLLDMRMLLALFVNVFGVSVTDAVCLSVMLVQLMPFRLVFLSFGPSMSKI